MTQHRDDQEPSMLDALIDAIIVDANSDDEKLCAFRQAFEDTIVVPCDAFVIGEPVSVRAFDYGGNERRGLTATCCRADGAEYVVAAYDVVLPARADAARYLAAYRRWLGLAPYPPRAAPSARPRRPHAVAPTDLDLSYPIDLVVLSVKDKAARCRLLASDQVITLRASRLWDLVPGEIVVVTPRKQWRYAGHPYLSGEIASTRLDVTALGLVPLRLDDRGAWNPDEEYWGETDEPIEEWAKPIIARGPRQEFEMEQVLPVAAPDSDSDPIIDSNELKEGGDPGNALKILMKLCDVDLRCLDAHAHLGNFVFQHRPAEAIRHYEVGLRIGELSLGDDFDGVLPWGLIDNRPFLRCLHSFGLCCWRLGRLDEAERVFDRMLWLNPSDNQGARFLIGPVRAGAAWEERDSR